MQCCLPITHAAEQFLMYVTVKTTFTLKELYKNVKKLDFIFQ